MSEIKTNILSKINSPADLKKLDEDELTILCDELRAFIIDVVSNHPGHLGANLGVIELTVALHYVFNTPYDKLVWDVGHQAYAHKILTGRRDAFHTNRMYNGISGFPKISESEYDAFGVGHSSTSISAALGMAIASGLRGETDRQHVAVIGDGSINAGMAFEGLNQTGVSKTNMLVILNDNGIAIDRNVGALHEYLTDITTSRLYNKIKDKLWKLLGSKAKWAIYTRFFLQKLQRVIKIALIGRSNLFEALGFRYFGPIDGHDIIRLVKILEDIKKIRGPKLLHCITVKGKGFPMAEMDQTRYHSPGMFDKNTGEIIEKRGGEENPPRYQDVFGNTIIELAEKNPKIIGITPAMATGCSLDLMMEKMPDRVFDVGIAEQHAVTFSAGLSAAGKIPFCNLYSSFMQRAYDQIIHDVALQKLNLVFCIDRGGLVGEDGPTHHGAYDLAYLRCIPEITIAAPMNEIELRNMMFTAQQDNMGTFAIRYPRGCGVTPNWQKPFEAMQVGKGKTVRQGEDIAVLTIGHVGNNAVEACKELEKENINAAHYDMRFLKPIDEGLLHEVFKKFDKVITIEDGTIVGGLGSAVLEFMADNKYSAQVERLGIPDHFIKHGKISELQAECHYDVKAIVKTTKKLIFASSDYSYVKKEEN